VTAEGNGDLQTLICVLGDTQTMSHIVKSCPLTKLNGGLSRLHSADEDAVSWRYGSVMVRDTHTRRRRLHVTWCGVSWSALTACYAMVVNVGLSSVRSRSRGGHMSKTKQDRLIVTMRHY